MDKTEKQKLMRQWLETPARLKPLQTRATRSKRAVKKADRAVIRSTSEQIKRGEQASQIWLALKQNNVITEKTDKKIIHHTIRLENATYEYFYHQFVNKLYSKKTMALLLSVIE